MLYSLLRELLFLLEPECAHRVVLKTLRTILPSSVIKKIQKQRQWSTYSQELFGLSFSHPVGLAAGLDKNGDYMDALLGLGFSFIEVGTVTPKPQNGNPKPRLFRVPEAQALINRMGFNNLGIDHVIVQLQQRRISGIVGVNIGKNRDTPLEKAAEDYCYCLEKIYPYADYVTINISSPNTPGLRKLQSVNYLNDLLIEITNIDNECAARHKRKLPLLIKIAPDISLTELEDLVKIICQHSIAGIIATNTSIDHSEVQNFRHGQEEGGVSGAPLFKKSTALIKNLAEILQGELPIIGVGGILSAQDALAKLTAGASLVQIYTGLIYQGPGLIRQIVRDCRYLPVK